MLANTSGDGTPPGPECSAAGSPGGADVPG
jgi:hypothetical protein